METQVDLPQIPESAAKVVLKRGRKRKPSNIAVSLERLRATILAVLVSGRVGDYNHDPRLFFSINKQADDILLAMEPFLAKTKAGELVMGNADTGNGFQKG